ncbi:hypothetical protein Q5752_001352 [Cryptotrichosporon argae]
MPAVQWSDAGEPYFAHPTVAGITITPYRDSAQEARDMVELYDHEIVGRTAFLRPWPYKPSDARWWLDRVVPAQRAAVCALRERERERAGAGTGTDAGTGARLTSVFTCVRDAAGHMIGDVGLWEDTVEVGLAEQADGAVDAGDELGDTHAAGENAAPAPPDSDVDADADADADAGAAQRKPYLLAYHLRPDFHGCRIGRDAVRVVLEWATDNLRPSVVVANVETTNAASQATVRALGFALARTAVWQWPADKGGGQREVGRWEWRL